VIVFWFSKADCRELKGMSSYVRMVCQQLRCSGTPSQYSQLGEQIHAIKLIVVTITCVVDTPTERSQQLQQIESTR
jgi:hypothetical protein